MKKKIILLLGVILLVVNLFAGQIFYVTTSGSDSNDGKSWATAFADVQKAIDAAYEVATDGSPSEVWIAAGTYKHGSAMTMKNNVEIYGGFAGTETSKEERTSGNETILDGEGTYRVFYNDYTEDNQLTDSAKIDNVVIKNGKTSYAGAGMYNIYANPKITNCIFCDNKVITRYYESLGGGIFNKNASPVFENCVFQRNVACIEMDTSTGSSYISGGGGVYAKYSSSVFYNCLFEYNLTNIIGAAKFSYVKLGGGAVCSEESYISFYNCKFYSNSNMSEVDLVKSGGGAIYGDFECVENCVFFNNLASSYGGAFCGSSEKIINCVFEKNTSNSAGAFTGHGNFMNCTFIENSFTNTGGVLSVSNSNIINCTFTRNSGPNNTESGTIFGNSQINVYNCTFSDNRTNYAITLLHRSQVSNIINCIFEGKKPPIRKIYFDTEYKLKNCICDENLENNIIKFGKLGYYGGIVPTMAILKDSTAINAGIVDENTPLTDARGFLRSVTNPTIGAYEYIEPEIIIQSSSKIVYTNTNTKISVLATSRAGDVIYIWQKLSDNYEWVDIDESNSSMLNFNNIKLNSSGKYRCIVSNIVDGLSVTSEEIVLTVVPSVSRVELSANRIMIVDGGYGRLEVSSDAVEPSYKWYYSANTGIDWVEIENSNSSVLEFKASSSMNRYQYKCVVTDGGGTSVESNKAVLIINSNAIVISQDIGDAMGFIGKETVLSVSATSSSSLGYQWQVSSDNGATWVDIKDATSSSLSLIPEDYELSGNLYRLKIDNGGGFIYSNVSSFTVFKNVEIREQPKDLIVWNAKNAEFEVSATGDGMIKYQWQILVGEEWRDIENAASAKLLLENVSTKMDGNKYRCAVSNEGTAVLYSNEATLTVYKTLEITSQPQEIWVFAGDSATFTVEVDAQGDVEYRWQEFIGGEWVDLENAALSEYQIPSMEDSFDGRKFRVLITNGGDVFASNEVLLKLATPVEITTQPQNIKLAYMGKMAVFSVEAVGYKPQYKWYVSGNYGTDEALEIDGATSNTLSISVDSDLVLENVYFCKITNDKSEKYSNLVYVEDIRTLSGYQSWAFDNGLDVDASASAISHGDGITNLEKYAFGLDASKATSYGANGNFKHSVESGVASFQFPVRKDASDISVKLMMSNDMSNWEEADAVSIGESGEFNLFNYSVPVPVNGKVFFKLKVLEK